MRPLRIVVLGGGTAGWMAATLIARRWRDRPVRLTVIESPDIAIIGVGEGSTPQLKAFFTELGLTEAEWMPACHATYKNGIRFTGWSDRPGYPDYFHPFPSPIDAHTSPAFYVHSHFRRCGADLDATPDRFFLSAHLARHRLAPIPARNFPFEMAYGYHFDAYLVGAFLRDVGSKLGVERREATVAEVGLSETGDVSHLSTADGDRIEGDFFIDSSGFRSLILQQALRVPFISFADNLFNDAAVVMPTPADPTSTPSETRATAMMNGWAWHIPLTSRHGNGYVYSTRYSSPEEAEAELRAHLGPAAAEAPARHLAIKVGRVQSHWHRNCLAVGLAQGFIEPLEATALHLVQATVDRFMSAWDKGGGTSAHAPAFNAEVNARFEGVRDYIVCHYRTSRRTDTAYWRDNAANRASSSTLNSVLRCWFSGGDMKAEIERLGISKYYPLTSWLCLLGGYGNYPSAAELRPPADDTRRFDLGAIDDFILRSAMNFPEHHLALGRLQ